MSESDALDDDDALLETLTEQFGEALVKKVREYCDDPSEARRALEEQYTGSFDSLSDWAEQLLDETSDLRAITPYLRAYFDFESYARDAELSGDIWSFESDGKVHVFWSN